MDDISNIRITEQNDRFLTRLVSELNIFKDDKSAAMFAISFAINHDYDIAIDEGYTLSNPTINKWDANSIDNDGLFRLLVSIRHPNSDCPFRIIQGILDVGLKKMKEEAPENGFIRISSFL